ncbi:MAG: ribonuclease T, partial [Cyanothece sp. SIO2G6]|nr:ribonuclease T [Cyanothece sp. SIO2G6]
MSTSAITSVMQQVTRLLAIALLISACWGMAIAPAQAFVPVNGVFIANDACAALQSIRKGTNPGNITLVPDMAYEVRGQNKPDPSHYQIKVKGGGDRWVPISCGRLLTNCSESIATPVTEQPTPAPSEPTLSRPTPPSGALRNCQQRVSTDNLLAISWQPAFCQNRRDKLECQTQDESNFDAEHFTLHGLWPQPRGKEYCCLPSNFPKQDWPSQPDFDDELSEETLALLDEGRWMPGYSSFLHRHEWYKHGTCYNPNSAEPEQEYFAESLALLEQVNTASVQQLFASRIGQYVSLEEIQAAFNQDFGPGAGNKVRLRCDDGLIGELWINLNGDIQVDTSLADLL